MYKPSNASAFALKSQTGGLQLMVDMTALQATFQNLGSNGRRRRRLSSSSEADDQEGGDDHRHHHRHLNPLEDSNAIYYDPSLQDNISPFWPGTTPEQEALEIQESIRNSQQALRDANALVAAGDCYQKWIIKRLRVVGR